jgi:hypothetical protein
MPKMSGQQRPASAEQQSYQTPTKQRPSELDYRQHLTQLKQDLVETPVSKHKHKQLARDLKETEKKGFSAAVKLVFERIVGMPRKVHWRIILDLADFAKRESKFEEAKILFKLITHLQPFAYQGWLEYAKMQEECGDNQAARRILHLGLKFNPLNDNLFVKAIKVEEKSSRDFAGVRELLG